MQAPQQASSYTNLENWRPHAKQVYAYAINMFCLIHHASAGMYTSSFAAQLHTKIAALNIGAQGVCMAQAFPSIRT